MIPKTRKYFPRLDFIATEFSRTETNRFFEVISCHPELGEEPFFLNKSDEPGSPFLSAQANKMPEHAGAC